MNEYLLPLFVFGSIVLALFAVSLAGVLILQRRRQLNHQLEKENLEISYQKDLLATRLEVQEQSMTLISEEIHDNVGQLLTMSRTYLSMLKKEDNHERNQSLIDRTFTMISQALTDLRHISHSLNGKLIAEMGLTSFLEKDLEHMTNSLGLKFNLQVIGNEELPLTQEQSLLLYRVIQESIQNVLKHAQATEVIIILNNSTDALDVKITDNGKGFDTENINYNSLGLRNMLHRAKLLKGELNLSSTIGKGTEVLMHIPKIPLAHE